MKKYAWLPILTVISVLMTCYMISRGYSDVQIFLSSLVMAAALGFVTGLAGYEA